VAIKTGSHPPGPFLYVVWDGSDESLVDVIELLGWAPPVLDGVLLVRLADGSMQPVKRGWAVYVEQGVVGVASAGVVAAWVKAA
jgi:hypothetical protein